MLYAGTNHCRRNFPLSTIEKKWVLFLDFAAPLAYHYSFISYSIPAKTNFEIIFQPVMSQTIVTLWTVQTVNDSQEKKLRSWKVRVFWDLRWLTYWWKIVSLLQERQSSPKKSIWKRKGKSTTSLSLFIVQLSVCWPMSTTLMTLSKFCKSFQMWVRAKTLIKLISDIL